MPDLNNLIVSLNWWQLLAGYIAIVVGGFFSGLGSSMGNMYGKRIVDKMEEWLKRVVKK